jgi:hypothetical protein
VGELGSALRQASLAGGPLDVVHYDACLMAMIENGYQIKDAARYWIASENLAWGTFAYDRYVGLADETTSPQQLAEAVVREYSALLSRYPHTIAAMDLGQAGNVADAVSALAEALQASLPEVAEGVRQARALAQKFDSADYYQITDEDVYLDLYDLARVLQQTVPDAAVQDAAQRVMEAVDRFVVAERRKSGAHGQHPYWDLDGAHGVAIWFPLKAGDWDAVVYHSGAYRFTSEGSWDEFLDAYLGIGGQPVTAFEAPGVPPVMMPDGGDGS